MFGCVGTDLQKRVFRRTTLVIRRGKFAFSTSANSNEVVEIEGLLRTVSETMSVEPVRLPGASRLVWPLERQRFLKVLERGRHIPYMSMARTLDTDILELVVLQGEELADPEDRNPLVLPADGFAVTRRMVHHLDYAGQWFVMGLIGFGIWVWHGFRRGRRQHGT